jgi:hypothetical protein
MGLVRSAAIITGRENDLAERFTSTYKSKTTL